MASKKPQNLKDFIFPLNMNGLQGRMLKVPSAKSREILLIYGHHATLERWFGLAQELLRYGGVTMPDLPGFGGMEALHKIDEKPSLDIYADYLAAFIKLRYKQRRLTIVAEGFGFLAATGMLQRYPHVAKKVDLVVSLASFAHYEDLQLDKMQIKRYRFVSRCFSIRLSAWVLKQTYLRPSFVQRAYHGDRAGGRRRLEATAFPARASDQSHLWRSCDLATHMATINAALSVNNCHSQIDAQVWVVNLPSNNDLNKHLAEQHIQIAYSKCRFMEVKVGRRKNFGSDAKTAALLLPNRLRSQLKKSTLKTKTLQRPPIVR